MKAVAQEKQILTQAGMDASSHAFDQKGPLDRFLAPLTHFNDLDDLCNKISTLYSES